MTLCAESRLDLDSLARAAACGDRAAMDGLLAVLRPRVIGYCRSRIRRGAYASAEDVAQEALLAVVTALPSYRDGGRGVIAFVLGIAAHKVVDFYRKQGRDRTVPVADVPENVDDRAGPEQAALRSELRRDLRDLLATLNPTQRKTLECRIVARLTAQETADLLGSTPGAIRVTQHRALEKLRGLLKHRGVPDWRD